MIYFVDKVDALELRTNLLMAVRWIETVESTHPEKLADYIEHVKQVLRRAEKTIACWQEER